MKNLIPILVLIFTLNLYASNDSEYEEVDGVLYKDHPEKTYEGLLTLFYENGSIEEELYYKNGLKDGPRDTFHANGELFEKETYKEGKLEGLFQGYYDNRKLWWEGDAKNGLRDGKISVFYASGKLKYIGQYELNLKEGLWKHYFEDGEIEKQECYHSNTLINIDDC